MNHEELQKSSEIKANQEKSRQILKNHEKSQKSCEIIEILRNQNKSQKSIQITEISINQGKSCEITRNQITSRHDVLSTTVTENVQSQRTSNVFRSFDWPTHTRTETILFAQSVECRIHLKSMCMVWRSVINCVSLSEWIFMCVFSR